MSHIERSTVTAPHEITATEAWEKALAASAEVALTAPSAYAIGLHLARVQQAHHLHDVAGLEAKHANPDAYHPTNGADILWDRAEALRDLIATMPATSLRDAAVILAEAAIVADRMNANQQTPEEAEKESGKLARMVATCLPWVARAAGLDVVDMDWDARCDLAHHYFVGVGAGTHDGVQP
jgi:hypothetical protein